MKKSLFKLAGIVMLASFTRYAAADEAWQTNIGRIVYADEIGPTAVFAYGPSEDPGVIYLLGLSKVYQNRGTYDGYWAKNKSKTECSTERPGIYGKMTRYWGRIQVKFIDKNFPSRWEAIWTYCDGPKENLVITATPQMSNQTNKK